MGQRLRRDSIGTGELDPGAAAAQQAQQRLESGRRRSRFAADIAEMPEHDIDRQVFEHAVEIGKRVDMHQEFDVPAERANALRKPPDALDRQPSLAFAQIDDVEAGAADTRFMHRL